MPRICHTTRPPLAGIATPACFRCLCDNACHFVTSHSIRRGESGFQLDSNMDKKWYNYFVSVDDPGAGPEGKGKDADFKRRAPETKASQTVAQIAASIKPEPRLSGPIHNPTSFAEIYAAAEIQPA